MRRHFAVLMVSAVLIVESVILVVGAPVLAPAKTRADRCAQLRLRAAAKAIAGILACFEKAAASGNFEGGCQTAVRARLLAAFARAERKHDCADADEAETVYFANESHAHTLLEIVLPREDCDDARDQDLDGEVDCADPDCEDDPVCRENCANGIDDDGNGLVDCRDFRCGDSLGCREWNCTNGVDDDGSGEADCEDFNCARQRSCAEDCTNGLDDNGNGLIDCADIRACDGALACREANCTNGLDDDASDGADCADPDCRSTATCDEYCANGVDDNGNGLVDCLDTVYCAGEAPCTETSCTNGLDDDGRGDVDCPDEDCSGDPACFEICDNGVDDNHDGLVDCRDFRCFGRAPCNGGGDDDDDDDRERAVEGQGGSEQTAGPGLRRATG